MSSAKLRSGLESIVKTVSISILAILSIEYSFRALIYIRDSISTYDKKKYEYLSIAFDNKYSKAQLKEMKRDVGDKLRYRPWIQIGNYDHRSKYSTVIDGRRKTKSTSLERCGKKKGIWFFGGSTTYGVGVPWDSTIASNVVKVADKREICIEAKNFGVPYHYFLQEVLYLSSELAKDSLPKPDIVIFTDGINDFLQAGSGNRNEPFFTPVLTSLIGKTADPNISKAQGRSIIPISFDLKFIDYLRRNMRLFSTSKDLNYYSNYQLPKNTDQKTAAKIIANNILITRKYLSKLCKSYGIECYQFIQPVSVLNYKSLYGESFTKWNLMKGTAERIKYGYNTLLNETNSQSLDKLTVIDISKIFSNYEGGIPYVDRAHYSPRASKVIAESIIEKIFK